MSLVEKHLDWVKVVDSKFGWDITMYKYEHPHIFFSCPHDTQIVVEKPNNVNLMKFKLNGKCVKLILYKKGKPNYYEGIWLNCD